MVILYALLGLFVGGLVNQLGSDLPARRGLTRPHCAYCGQERPRWQWLALPAYLIGRARCPHCAAPIRWRYPLVEIGLATAYAYLWIVMDSPVKLAFYLVYAAIFALILVTDIERRLILNVVTFPAIGLAIVASFLLPDILPRTALAGGAIGLLTFFVLVVIGKRVFGSGALGEGDITLATFIGLITGFPLIIEALVLTTLVGAGISSILLIARVRSLRDHIPYGPFLIVGATITLLQGYSLANWFLNR